MIDREERPIRRHAAYVDASVWIEPQRSPRRVQIALGPGNRYSFDVDEARRLAALLIEAADELDQLSGQQ